MGAEKRLRQSRARGKRHPGASVQVSVTASGGIGTQGDGCPPVLLRMEPSVPYTYHGTDAEPIRDGTDNAALQDNLGERDHELEIQGVGRKRHAHVVFDRAQGAECGAGRVHTGGHAASESHGVQSGAEESDR